MARYSIYYSWLPSKPDEFKVSVKDMKTYDVCEKFVVERSNIDTALSVLKAKYENSCLCEIHY